MFGFMKKHSEKEKEEKDKRKKEKKEKKRQMERPLTSEELQRLEEAKRGLYRKGSDSNYTYQQPTRPPRARSSGDGATPSGSSDSLSSPGRESTPDTYTSTAKVDISRNTFAHYFVSIIKVIHQNDIMLQMIYVLEHVIDMIFFIK